MLDWNNHSCVMMVDNYILVSGHLAAKKGPNETNIKDLKAILPILKTKFPEHDIICGCDCNSFLAPFSETFQVYPDKNDNFTTLKRRTRLQAQFEKS